MRSLGRRAPRSTACLELLQRPLEEQVLAGRAELGIADTAGLPAALAADELWVEDAYACVPAAHPLAGAGTLRLRDLRAEPILGFPTRARLRVKLDEALAAVGRQRAPTIVVEQYATLVSLIAAGRGVGVVPGVLSRHLPATVTPVLLDEPALRRTVGAARRRGVPLSRAAEHFVAALRHVIEGHPALRVPEHDVGPSQPARPPRDP